jgi:hypothetical protein
MNMQKIALINCYFGEFPWYFDFFIKSCVTNPTIDFIIFSDCSYKKELPQNVCLIPFTMSDFNSLASKKLNLTIAVKSPYKLCDFKPAYGVIFSNYLLDYDFWGMCDLDIVLGRIREFMTPELLNEYDVISTRHDYVTGWFMLFKNIPEINNLFRKSADYEKVFTSNTHYCFDECNFKQLKLDDENVSILDIPCEIESMEHVIQKELHAKRINVFYDLIMVDGLCGKVKWDNGTLSYNNDFEILLYHLIRYKANQYSQKPAWQTIPSVFYIDKYCFRGQATTTILGFFNYFYFNILKLFVVKIIHLSKFYISSFFPVKNKIPFQNGKFKNRLGDDCFWITENAISFKENGKTNKLISSRFGKELFYIKKHPWLVCRYFRNNSEILPKIQLIQIDGSIVNYELKTETKDE